MKYLLTTITFCFLTLSALAQTESLQSKGEKLYNSYKNKKALEVYQNILKKDNDNLSALWHTSLLYSRLGEQTDDGGLKKKYYNKAKKTAQKALEIDENDSRANFAMSIALGEMARSGGVKEKLEAASDIKKYAVAAIHADSSNAGAWFILGAWNYKIATMSSVKETFANLFADIPKGASTEKAVNYMKKAINLHPSYILYYYGLAQVYKTLDKDSQAVKACHTALQKQDITQNDTDYKKKCKKLIDKVRAG